MQFLFITAKNAVLKLSFSHSGWVEPNQAPPSAPTSQNLFNFIIFRRKKQRIEAIYYYLKKNGTSTDHGITVGPTIPQTPPSIHKYIALHKIRGAASANYADICVQFAPPGIYMSLRFVSFCLKINTNKYWKQAEAETEQQQGWRN